MNPYAYWCNVVEPRHLRAKQNPQDTDLQWQALLAIDTWRDLAFDDIQNNGLNEYWGNYRQYYTKASSLESEIQLNIQNLNNIYRREYVDLSN